ncbi:hypothetical protein VTI74DRAFT_11383 [Chaetomium olivicolor]
MQHPPPTSLPQAVLPSAQVDIPPPHIAPAGQHPTGPSPVSGTCTHFSPCPQQLLGYPIEEQLAVPLGQAHWRFSSKARAEAARRKRSHAGGGAGLLSPSTVSSGPARRANGGRKGSSADELAASRKDSCVLRVLRAAIAACGLCDVAAKEWWSGKAQYSW